MWVNYVKHWEGTIRATERAIIGMFHEKASKLDRRVGSDWCNKTKKKKPSSSYSLHRQLLMIPNLWRFSQCHVITLVAARVPDFFSSIIGQCSQVEAIIRIITSMDNFTSSFVKSVSLTICILVPSLVNWTSRWLPSILPCPGTQQSLTLFLTLDIVSFIL